MPLCREFIANKEFIKNIYIYFRVFIIPSMKYYKSKESIKYKIAFYIDKPLIQNLFASVWLYS